MEDTELSNSAKNYDTVRKAFISRFEKPEALEEKIQPAVSCSFDAADFRFSLLGIDYLFKKAAFDRNGTIGLLRKAVMELPELYHFFKNRNRRDYSSLKVSVLSFHLAKEEIFAGSSGSSFTPKKIT